MLMVAVLMTQKFEDSEAREPLQTLRDRGFHVEVISPKAGEELQGKKGEFTVTSDRSIAQAQPDNYAALVIPGGHSPEQLRVEPGAVEFVREFGRLNRPIAAICHGPQLLISAELVKGRKMTCYKTIAVDLKNAGAHYEDSPLVVDGNFITSRQPSDLPRFCEALLQAVEQAAAPRR